MSSTESSSLAVRYRPRSFAEVVGQRHVTKLIAPAIARGLLPPQILFSGASGLGKTTLARITAAALLCETPLSERENADVCLHCSNCIDITSPNRVHPDVVEFDAASHGGKDEIRSIAERAQLSPIRAEKKIYIIDEAHGLSGPGGQAFLKLLEEPPPHVVFMLATTDPDKMLKTNRSRCTEYELLAPSQAEMAQNLVRVAKAEAWPLSDEAALAIVESSDPALGVRATLMSLEKLAALLDDGEELSAENVLTSLGHSSAAEISRIVAAVDELDPHAAFAALTAARSSATDAAIHASLVSWASQALLDSTPDTFALSRTRLATLLATTPKPAYLDLAIADLTAPTPDSPAGLPALINRAETLALELSNAIGTLAAIPTPAAASDEITPAVFIEAVRRESPDAADLLEHTKLHISPGKITIAALPDQVAPLKAFGDSLRAVATSFSIVLTLSKMQPE